MPNGELEIYKYLRRGIQDEIMSLKELCKQVDPLIKRAEQADQDSLIFYTRAAGSILHDFYTGVERIFQEIAKKLNGGLPKGDRWHMELLESMAKPMETRPPVISRDLKDRLKEYLGFRHLFRSIYGSELKWDKLKHLLVRLCDSIWKEFHKDIGSFDTFLQDVLKETEEQ